MRKISFFLLSLLLTLTLNAQTYSIKKGKISMDDVPIAKYDGKGGLFKNLKIKIASLDDQPLMAVEQFNNDFKNPLFQDDRRWLIIVFETTPSKTLAYRLERGMTEKMVMNELFKDSTVSFIKDNKLNEEQIEKFIAANQYDYKADSLAIMKMEEENRVRIRTPVPRDKTQPVELRSAGRIGEMRYFDIYQANVLVGRLEKRIQNFSTPKYDYSVWMKTDPFSFQGKDYPFSPVAFFTNASPLFDNRVTLMKDKSEVKFKTPGEMISSADYSFVMFLINTGNL